MKKRIFIYAIMVILSALLLSCSLNEDDDEDEGAMLKVCNNSESEYEVITAVYLSKNDSENKTLVYSGDISRGDFYYIDVDSGSYRVWCVVEKRLLGIPVTYENYDTGYKNNVELGDGDVVEVDFDGNGIYKL